MPIYEYSCPNCGLETEVLRYSLTEAPNCVGCLTPMEKKPSLLGMVKIKGEGGYPSRRKQVFNTTEHIHPKLEHEPNRSYR